MLSVALIYLWMALVDSFEFGSLTLAILLGLTIPIATRSIWESTPRIGSIGRILLFVTIILWDILLANVQVAMTILLRPASSLQPKWIAVPLDLNSQEAVAALAGIVSLTPGTVSCDLSADGRSLLVHALDTTDTEAEIRKIKDRYEARLRRIFE